MAQAASVLAQLPVGQPVDAIVEAVWREARFLAGAWQRLTGCGHAAVADVLQVERRLERQLGALGLLWHEKLARRLRRIVQDASASEGAAFAAAALLLHRDRQASQTQILEAFWQAPAGPQEAGLGRALQLYGMCSPAWRRQLAQALTSRDPQPVQRAALLVACAGLSQRWPTPNLHHPQGVRAAVLLMGQGLIAFDPQILAAARTHEARAVRQAWAAAWPLVCPQHALQQARRALRGGQALPPFGLQVLGLWHTPGEAASEQDLALVLELSRAPGCAKDVIDAIDALGLMGRQAGAEAALTAAHRNADCAGAARRCLQAIFALDDETWAAHGQPDVAIDAQMLQRGLANALAPPAHGAAPREFVPRGPQGMLARLHACDMTHFGLRAQERHMRSGGQARLFAWAYLSPQLARQHAHG